MANRTDTCLSPSNSAVRLSEAGLFLGPDVLLMRRTEGDPRNPLALDDRERLTALLSIVARRPVGLDLSRHVEAASEIWQRGDKALAQIRLAVSPLPRLVDLGDAERLRLAAQCLDEGMAPDRLMKELGLGQVTAEARKYNENHVAAGNGRASGRFASRSGESVAYLSPSAIAAFLRGQTSSILDPNLSPTLIARLAAFAARFAGPTAVLGTLLIPTPNSGGVTEGTLPSADDIRFRHDGPEGLLALAYKLADGSEVRVQAESRGGVFIDPKTATAIGRDLGEQLALDLPALHLALATALKAEHKEVPKAWAATDEDEPKLCKKPVPDKPHGASEPARRYERDLHRRVNPLAPIPDGYAIRIWDKVLHRFVHFDDCFRYAGDLVDGDMKKGDLADAKGKRKEYLYSKEWARTMKEDAEQAKIQLRVADSLCVSLKWYYAEKGAADAARAYFAAHGLGRIIIGHMPPSQR